MPRFRKRPLQWSDVIGRFESQPYSYYLNGVRGLVGGLKDEAKRFWDRDSQQYQKWEEYCTNLLSFLNDLGRRRNSMNQNLETAMREYIQIFEHSTARMYQLLFEFSTNLDKEEDIRQVMELFHWVFRASTYALVSAWIDDKRESDSLRTMIDATTGAIREEGTRMSKRVPKEYRKSTRRI